MSAPGLDEPCRACQRRSGDHTLDEWAACLANMGEEIPFAESRERTPDSAQDELRRRFNLEDGQQVADNVIARAAVLDVTLGTLAPTTKLPAMLLDFESSASGLVTPLASIAFISDPDSMRKCGKLMRDTANGAANASERS